MKMFSSFAVVLSLAALMAMLWGCGDNGTAPEPTAAELTAAGWLRFETGDYRSALSRFEQATRTSAGYGEAYNGIGWCCIWLDSLDAALDGFDQAISNSVAAGDPRAGKSVVYRDRVPLDLEAAIDWADSALAIDPGYVFTHDTTFDWYDLRLIRAHSYFELALYDQAKTEIDILSPANTVDPAADTFVEDLLAELQRLGDA
jgi:tetratricopeptide (TPR) repeat protein